MGGTSCRTRRSTASGEATSMAAETSGRILAHDHRYAASGGGAGRCALAFSHNGARLACFHALRISLISDRATADMRATFLVSTTIERESRSRPHAVNRDPRVCATAGGDGSVRLTVGFVAL